MGTLFSSLREIWRMFLLYVAAGAAAIPFGLIYGLLVIKNWDHWAAVMALLGSGTLTAHLVWVALDKRSLTRRTLERKRADSAGIAAAAEIPKHILIPALFGPYTTIPNFALPRYDLGSSEIEINAAQNTVVTIHVADTISIRMADEVSIGASAWIRTIETEQPLARQYRPASRTNTPTAAGTLALVA